LIHFYKRFLHFEGNQKVFAKNVKIGF